MTAAAALIAAWLAGRVLLGFTLALRWCGGPAVDPPRSIGRLGADGRILGDAEHDALCQSIGLARGVPTESDG